MGCCNARDVGAPRAVGDAELSEEALEAKEEKRKDVEQKLSIVHKGSSMSSRVLRQRSEVDHIRVSMSRGGSVSQALSSSNSMESHSGAITASQGLPVSNMNSQLEFMKPDQTIIIFDWDDTLCPSTWLRRFVRFDNKGRLAGGLSEKAKRHLEMLSAQAIPLLRASQAMGKTVLVTNARRPWVETSCASFLPSLKGELQGIPILYAMELLEDRKHKGVNTKVLTESKMRAMKVAVSEFYSRYERQSWKNMVSIGDALYEHDAIRQVAAERPSEGGESKRCRTKTIKLIEGPSVEGVVVQLNIVESCLAKIVQADNDVNIDFSADEEQVSAWLTEYATKDAPQQGANCVETPRDSAASNAAGMV